MAEGGRRREGVWREKEKVGGKEKVISVSYQNYRNPQINTTRALRPGPTSRNDPLLPSDFPPPRLPSVT